MTTSRRGFLRFGAGAATAAAMPWPLTGVSGAAHSSHSDQAG